MTVLQFIFSSFWVFVGVLVLLGALLDGIAKIITACRKN